MLINDTMHTRTKIFASAVLVLALLVLSFARNSVWTSEVSLWEDAVRKSPEKAGAYYSLSIAYAKAGQYENAFLYMRKSIQLDGGVQFKAWLEDRSTVPVEQGGR